MKDFATTQGNLAQVQKAIQALVDEHHAVIVNVQPANTGKWGMARLWRAWMTTTAEWMAGRGATMPLCLRPDGSHYGERPFNPEDAHELFTHQWLGADADGNRLSWSKTGRDGMRPATKGDRFLAMQRHEDWATERGIILVKPRDSEYAKIEREGGDE